MYQTTPLESKFVDSKDGKELLERYPDFAIVVQHRMTLPGKKYVPRYRIRTVKDE
ncbi:MAG: hypothetical protein ACU837_04245 [Gammaproteobacteria bacterium]